MITRDQISDINFENPSQADIDKLTIILENEGRLVRHESHIEHFGSSNNKVYRFNYRLGLYRGTICLMYDYERRRPFKKTFTSSATLIEFISADRILACKNGSILYEYEQPEVFEKYIKPVVQALGFEFTCDGEFRRPGTPSGWHNYKDAE